MVDVSALLDLNRPWNPLPLYESLPSVCHKQTSILGDLRLPRSTAVLKVTFLSADWRYLLMFNYSVDSEILRPHVPCGTELDTWHGRSFVTLVGFRFLNARVLGWSIPGHQQFDEVNLRFYVRRFVSTGWRRGVVFIREMVPRRAVAAVARLSYNEPYETIPIVHRIDLHSGRLTTGSVVQYRWRRSGVWSAMSATIAGGSALAPEGSEAHFIMNHYYGYTRRRDGHTQEYHVQHVPWRMFPVTAEGVDYEPKMGDGEVFSEVLSVGPHSAFLADGSSIVVGKPVVVRGPEKSEQVG